jgi:glycosyltransferase involved in cell wall biosynthesis
MRLVDLVIVHTECSGNAVDHDSIHVIPYGVYPCEDIPAKEARKKFSIPNEAKVLLFFGNLRPYKGLDLLLKSFKHIARNDKNVWLIIAGRPWKDFDDYLNLINSFGEDISSRIILRDEFVPESQVPFYFSAADLLVLPYKQFDSQSGVIMLTMSCGLPYVVSDVKGLREFALDSSLISKVDSQDLSFVIERILSSPSKLEELHSDLKSLRAKYSWVNYARKIKELWNISVNTKEEE